MTTKLTAIELQAQIEAGKKMLYELQEQERKATYEAQQAARREANRLEVLKTREKNTVVAKALIAALKNTGFEKASYKFSEDSSNPTFTVLDDGSDSYSTYSVKLDTWNSPKIVVGSYQSHHNFPMKKDGTFNYVKITETVKELYGYAMIKKTNDNRRDTIVKNNKVISDRLIDKFGHKPYESATYKILDNITLSPDSLTVGNVIVKVNCSPSLDEDNAARLITLIHDFMDSIKK
jgi:hypothetical protein